ncbi:MAG TPA: hypothetical protein VGQ89_05235 [Candidatus Limnocylindrales bacterium]|nr:hypothetical protein [Candidatus Limnocylindrales bacterium]
MRGGTGRVDRRRVAVLVFGLVVAAIASGCQYLFGYGPNPPDFGMPQPVAVYREGRATVKLGDEPIMALDELEDTGSFDPSFGAGATFHNADGWYVKVMGASKAGRGFLSSPAFVSLDRIVGTQHWTVADPTRCVVTIFAADATGLMGAATCKGLRWSDALGSYDVTFQPPYIKDQPAFDAEITFEATASTKQVG